MNTSMFLGTIDIINILLNGPKAPEDTFWNAPRVTEYRHRLLRAKQVGMVNRVLLDYNSANRAEFSTREQVLVVEYFLYADKEGKHVQSYMYPSLVRVGELASQPFEIEWEILPFSFVEIDCDSKGGSCV